MPAHDLACHFPIISTHFGLTEALAWERHRSAIFLDEIERTPQTRDARRYTFEKWEPTYLRLCEAGQ